MTPINTRMSARDLIGRLLVLAGIVVACFVFFTPSTRGQQIISGGGSSGTSVTPFQATFNTTNGTCVVSSGTGSCTAASTGYTINGVASYPGVTITDGYGSTITRIVGGVETSTGLQWGSAGATAGEGAICQLAVCGGSNNVILVPFTSAAIGTITDTIPSMGSTGAPGATGATGSTGAAGSNGTNGTNGAISQIYNNGSAQTVRPYLNLISGTNATVTCVDNSGATRSDCTVSASAGQIPLVARMTSTYATTSTTLANLTGLSFSLASSSIYDVNCHIPVDNAGNNGQGVKLGFSYSGNITQSSWEGIDPIGGINAIYENSHITITGALTAPSSQSIYTHLVSVAASTAMWIKGVVVTSTSGTLQFMGAQGQNGSGNTTFSLNSNWATCVMSPTGN